MPTVDRGLLLVVFCSMLIGRRQPADLLDLRLLERGEELPGVAGEALDVAPLALGIERVDRQRALARAARPAADGHLVAGDVDVDPLEVVLPRPPDGDRRRGPPPTTCAGLRPSRLAAFALAASRGRRAAVEASRQRPGRCGSPATAATCSGVPSATIAAAAGAPFGAEVDDPVGGLDHVEVVLDDDDRVALRGEAVQHLQQLAGRRRSAGRWSARRGCRASCPCPCLTSSRASLIRWASPPESVGEGWPSLR